MPHNFAQFQQFFLFMPKSGRVHHIDNGTTVPNHTIGQVTRVLVLSEPQALVLKLRALERSDLSELSFSIRQEENGELA